MKKNRLIIILCLVLTFFLNVSAQTNDPIAITVGDRQVTRSELQYFYQKNNISSGSEKKNVEEYAKLYCDFLMKVEQARQLGLDTIKTFVQEYNGYRAQLAVPYLYDKTVEDSLYREAYERMKEDVEVQHMLVRLPKNYTSNDTLKYYQQAQKLCERAEKEGFTKVAKEVMAEITPNAPDGYLGWFTGGMSVYPLENAIYNTEVGKISQPVRVGNAYYIVKVLNRQKAHGKIRCSHIFVRCEETMSAEEQRKAKEKITKAQQALAEGKTFEQVAKEFSEDPRSASIGGDLSWFGVGLMVREFETAAFNLQKIGDVSEPVKSVLGWHIIKLVDRKGIDSFEEQKPNIKRLMEYDGRMMIMQQCLVEKLKKEYHYVFDANSWKGVVSALNGISIDNKNFDSRVKNLHTTIASFATHSIKQTDFVAYLKQNASNEQVLNEDNLKAYWNRFLSQEVLAYEDAHLEEKYPELRYLLKEYHDGILLFNISSKEVWDKATQDTAGLAQYFNTHKEQYTWNSPRFKGRICCCRDKQTAKVLKKMLEIAPKDSINNYISTRINIDTAKYVETYSGIWKVGESKVIDRHVFHLNVPDDTSLPKDLPVVFTWGNLQKNPECYQDVRGAVISDYQTYLETLWVKQLAEKIPHHINLEVVKTIKSR
ncbi:MAG: peptidylprolyl isomerase [Bacteroidales bacterium]|nr:peptidylprolyl isomerase [Bacteroidales bacterium]